MRTRGFSHLPVTTRAYIGAVVLLGSLTIGHSVAQLIVHRIGWSWATLALLTLISGSATVHLPGLPATVSVSETFVFTSVLLFGSAAGTITVALDALIISLWSFRKGHPYYKIPFNICAASLALWVAAWIYYSLSPYGPLYYSPGHVVALRSLLTPLICFTISYYALNTGLVSCAIALEREANPLKIWKDNFLWVAVNYFGGASVAALLVAYTHDVDYSFLVIIVPLLVVLYLTFSTSMGRVEDANRHLSELNTLYMSTIETLAMAIDAKDQITHGHIRRVQLYAVGLAKAMGVSEESQIRAIEAAALLHDMGKLAVPEYILNKPGPLTAAEFEKMKLHASVGADILSSIAFPYPVVPIVRHHHENWDGTGYPDKIAGTAIPMGARILSVVDCFDALTSDRPYRPRLADKDALRILQERRGTMYDPLVVDTFTKVHSHIIPASNTPASGSIPLGAITAVSAGQSVGTISSADRFDDITASSEEMLALFELARSLTASMGISDATELIAKYLRRLISSSACVFYFYQGATDDLVASHTSGEHGAHIKGLRVPMGQRLSGWVAANRQTVRNSDPVLDLGEAARGMTPRPRSCLSTPLLSGKRLIGVLSLYSSHKDAFSEDHERIIEAIARQVSSPLYDALGAERARAQRLEANDSGLPNLRQLLELIDTQNIEGEFRPYSLVLLSIGDRTSDGLIEVTNVAVSSMRWALRSSDLVFKTSSGEFVALLLNTERAMAATIARSVTEAVDTRRRSTASRLSFAVATATAPEDGTRPSDVLEIARRRAVKALASGSPAEPIH